MTFDPDWIPFLEEEKHNLRDITGSVDNTEILTVDYIELSHLNLISVEVCIMVIKNTFIRNTLNYSGIKSYDACDSHSAPKILFVRVYVCVCIAHNSANEKNMEKRCECW